MLPKFDVHWYLHGHNLPWGSPVEYSVAVQINDDISEADRSDMVVYLEDQEGRFMRLPADQQGTHKVVIRGVWEAELLKYIYYIYKEPRGLA